MLRLAPLLVLLAACSTDAPVDDAPAPDPTPAADAAPASSATDACEALDAETIRPHLPDAAGADIRAEDVMDVSGFGDRYLGCSWLWGRGHQVNLQITTEPAGNRFDTWGSRMLAARLDDGYTSIDGLGDGAAFTFERASEVFWHEGEGRIYSLSYTGPTLDARLDQEQLVAIAQSVAL